MGCGVVAMGGVELPTVMSNGNVQPTPPGCNECGNTVGAQRMKSHNRLCWACSMKNTTG